MDNGDSLVSRRSRRSTAGNRMEAVLAEIALEDEAAELEEDNDFFVENGILSPSNHPKDEEDVFGSDFESTDDEAAQPALETDKVVQEEERTQRKTARTRVEKATAAAAVRQRVTFNPEAYVPAPDKDKKKRRVSLGIDSSTGEVISTAKRQSGRSHTVLARSATITRMKEEVKKSTLPKKTKIKTRAPTQDELIARALDMEEDNIVEHRDYLMNEEERRKRAHVVRTAVEGPLVRWISRREEVTIPIDPPPSPTKQPSVSVPARAPEISNSVAPQSSAGSTCKSCCSPNSCIFMSLVFSWSMNAPISGLVPPPSIDPLHASSIPPIDPPPPKKETVTRNYVIHEASQGDDARKPGYMDTMSALFGDHVKWDELKVYGTKNRPLSRPIQVCPITGLPARYLDPRSGVPYATPAAFRTITKILNHEYIWSPTLGCYITNEFEPVPVPAASAPDKGKKRAKKDKEVAMDVS
ncbi:YL1 nuclear protein-domain-containing protein [Amylostereum chailletii]|nr:YL1 nuclear protein-domain-containing protein [Amylostereum chailletii]